MSPPKRMETCFKVFTCTYLKLTLFFFFRFIYLGGECHGVFTAALGLPLAAGSDSYSLLSCAAAHCSGSSRCRQGLGAHASAVAARELSSRSSQARECGVSSCAQA